MDEERGEEQPQLVDLTALDLDPLLSLFINILATKAWQYMGIRIAPGKEEPEKDMVKASAAINCVSSLANTLANNLPEAEASRLRAVVADLQINYAKQS